MIATLAALTAATLLGLHNQARAAYGLPCLRTDPQLAQAALAKARDIERCGFAHDACGRPWAARLPARSWLGENIASGYPTAPVVVAAWLRSPGHRANILRRQFRRVGFAHLGSTWVAEFSS